MSPPDGTPESTRDVPGAGAPGDRGEGAAPRRPEAGPIGGAMVRQVELILSQISSLPTLSPIAAKLMTVAGADDADLREIAQLIESDPGLAARILGLCRRADRGLAQRVTSVRHAVLLLGLEAVRACVLSVHIYDIMQAVRPRAARHLEEDAEPGALGGFDRPGFWRHSIAVACASEMLAEEVAGLAVAPEEAFLAGLVHDLGTLTLEFILPQAYQRVLELAERRRESGAVVEREVLGIDRFTAGRRLAEHWRLPDSIVDVIWLHGQGAASVPESAHRQLVALVTLARAVCRSLHLGWCADFSGPPDLSALCGPLGVDPDALHLLAEPLQRAVSERCSLLGLDTPPSTRVLLDALGGANRQLSRLTMLLRERARLTSLQTRALAAIRAFHLEQSAARGLVEVLGCVADSAMEVVGVGSCEVAVRTPEADDARVSEPWRVYSFVAESTEPVRSRPTGWRPVGAGESGPRRLGDVMSMLRSEGGRSWHAVALGDAGGPEAVGVLLVPADAGEILTHESIAGALGSGWGSAVRSALEMEDSHTLSERLADVNRALLDTQSRLAETESMARLGEMTAGAAHEMNNPLTVISGRSQLLAARLMEAADRASAEAIAEAADDLSGLITSLHLLAEPPRPNAAAVPSGTIVDEAMKVVEQRLKFSARVRREIEAGGPAPWADGDLAARALAELIINAVEAAPGREPLVRAFHDSARARAVIEVLDEGPGMSKRSLQHAFDPFFSEKPAGRQRGLGLTRARRLVEIQGGRVSLTLREGGGARAVIELPTARARTAGAAAEADRAARKAA